MTDHELILRSFDRYTGEIFEEIEMSDAEAWVLAMDAAAWYQDEDGRWHWTELPELRQGDPRELGR